MQRESEQCNSKPEAAFSCAAAIVRGGFVRSHANPLALSRRSVFLTTSRGVLARRIAFCRLVASARKIARLFSFFFLLQTIQTWLSISVMLRPSCSPLSLSLFLGFSRHSFLQTARSITRAAILAALGGRKTGLTRSTWLRDVIARRTFSPLALHFHVEC